MTRWLADTYYWLALLTRHDEAHGRALAVLQELKNPIVTTGWVLAEVADGLAPVQTRGRFGQLLNVLAGNSWVTILAVDQDQLDQGIQLYLSRPDKDLVSH